MKKFIVVCVVLVFSFSNVAVSNVSAQEENEALENSNVISDDNSKAAIDEAIDSIEESAKEKIKELGKVKDDFKDTVNNTVNETKSDSAINVDSIVKDAKDIANDAKEFGLEAKEKAIEVKDKVINKVNEFNDNHVDTKNDLKQKFNDIKEDVVNKAKEIGDSVKEKAVDVKEDVSNKVKEVKESVYSDNNEVSVESDTVNNNANNNANSNAIEAKLYEKDNGNAVTNKENGNAKLYDSALDFEDPEEKLKREKFIADYKQARTNEALVDILRSKAIDARVDNRGIIINLENALFEFNSAELSSKALPQIKEIANFLQSVPSRSVSAQGHTDSVGTVLYNHKLSQGRAQNVVEELVKNGVSRSRLEFKGYGESDPIATNRTEEGRNRNRRVELVIK